MNSKYTIYAGIAVGVAAMTGIMVYGTANQENYIPDDAVAAPATVEGSFTSKTGLGPQLNKEQWHEDPFGDIAAKVRADAGV